MKLMTNKKFNDIQQELSNVNETSDKLYQEKAQLKQTIKKLRQANKAFHDKEVAYSKSSEAKLLSAYNMANHSLFVGLGVIEMKYNVANKEYYLLKANGEHFYLKQEGYTMKEKLNVYEKEFCYLFPNYIYIEQLITE